MHTSECVIAFAIVCECVSACVIASERVSACMSVSVCASVGAVMCEYDIFLGHVYIKIIM